MEDQVRKSVDECTNEDGNFPALLGRLVLSLEHYTRGGAPDLVLKHLLAPYLPDGRFYLPMLKDAVKARLFVKCVLILR